MKSNFSVITEDNLSTIKNELLNFETDIYHSIDWLLLNKDLQEGEISCIFLEDGKNCAFFPLIKRNIKNTAYFDLITPYGYGGVAFKKATDIDFKEKVFEELNQHLSTTNCISVFLRLHPLLNKVVVADGAVFENGTTLAIKLNNSYPEIYSKYSSGHKYDLKKSKKNENICIIDHTDFLYFDDFIEIYLETMRYLDASDFYFFDKEYFYRMKKLLAEKLKLVVVKLNDQIIGASLFMLHNGIIQYHLSGTTIEGRKYQPSKLILDYMVNWGVSQGYTFLHLGGGVGGQQDALYKFKKGFSADDYSFYTVRLITNNNIYRTLCSDLNFTDVEIDNISDFFPLYRKV
ncbi:GNAT family N-acetyltransferase [Acinetobacter sp. YH16049]|uniref:GNAT family N-acetyltransferase n=1 Tax=Acinetobacter sp. YH16049 TaxID=2601188 RepID=UPI0015D19862